MDPIIQDIMVGRLVEIEIRNKENGGKICTSCGIRRTDPTRYRRVKWCYVCLDEHNRKEVGKLLDRLIGGEE
jgi:hypothetical protein